MFGKKVLYFFWVLVVFFCLGVVVVVGDEQYDLLGIVGDFVDWCDDVQWLVGIELVVGVLYDE